jgi:integrase
VGRNAKIAMAVSIKTAPGKYPRHEILFKNGKPRRCRLNAGAPEIDIPDDAAFYVTHPKGANPAKPETRATPLPGTLERALIGYRQFEADFQRRQQGLTLLTDFTTNKPAPASGSRTTIVASIEKYLRDKTIGGLRKTSIAAYRGGLEDFKKSCKKTFVDELTKDDLAEYLSWMRESLRRNSVGQQNITFRKRLGFVNAWTKEFTEDGLWSKKNRPKVNTVVPDSYDDETRRAILKAATAEERLRILFLFYSGGRDMEVATAEINDLDVRRGIFRIQAKPHIIIRGESWQPKTGGEREQALPREFIKELVERQKGRTNPLLFPNSKGNVDHNLIEFLQKAARRAGVEIKGRVTQHRIRRTAIGHVGAKFGLQRAMDFAGHSRATTTDKYIAKNSMTNPKIRPEVEEAMAELVGD